LEVGLEFRKNLFGRFTFYHGLNLGFSNSGVTLKNKDCKGKTFANMKSNYYLSVPSTFGFLFNMRPNFYLFGELNPAIYYATSSNGNSELLGVGLSNRFGFCSADLQTLEN